MLKIVGHRGAPALAPENTIASLLKAVELGVDYVEFDVRATADGVLVLMHDEDLRRLAGIKRRVREMTWRELSRVRIRGEPVATLQAALDALRGKVSVIVEIKEPDIVSKVVNCIVSSGILDESEEVIVASFHHPAVKRARELEPRLLGAVILVCEPCDPAGLADAAKADYLAIHHKYVTRELVERAEGGGKRIIAWTVNDPARLRELGEIGVHAVATDDPRIARQKTLL